MKRTRVSFWIMIALFACTLTAGRAAAYPIDYVLGSTSGLANRMVTIRGVVANARVITPPETFTGIRGEYELCDESGASILVRTKTHPPANGVVRSVRGVLDISMPRPFLLASGRVVMDPLWLLYAAFIALFALAAYLLALIFKGSAPARAYIRRAPAAGRTPRVDVVAGSLDSGDKNDVCPSCQAVQIAAAHYCASCGRALAPPALAMLETAPGIAGEGPSGKPTVEIPLAPEECPLADLVAVGGEGARYGEVFPLCKERQTIGRREDMDIRLADETVSREHASIWWQEGTFYIQDEASKSGTAINGQRIVRKPLSDRDEIVLGRTRLIFRILAYASAGR